ncbi:hypothetical protein CEXT_109631 [Caerostris extrusa]|uniref:Uncharacterized protein n=1 Tax=Caerostris extrusa TaxID=172846 RepID=A0AAV4MAL5_CAEEX|nr:hypothetical protein CEXT_109631 [Caerostris extrusa]
MVRKRKRERVIHSCKYYLLLRDNRKLSQENGLAFVEVGYRSVNVRHGVAASEGLKKPLYASSDLVRSCHTFHWRHLSRG